jgi:alanine dehydrogenase
MITRAQRSVVGVAAELADRERRVAVIPIDIQGLMQRFAFVIEASAGNEAGFSDKEYVNVGASPADSTAISETRAVSISTCK